MAYKIELAFKNGGYKRLKDEKNMEMVFKELSQADRYIIKHGGYYGIIDLFNVDRNEIKGVKITSVGKDIKYSLPGNNKYINAVLDSISVANVKRYSSTGYYYYSYTDIIDSENESLIEMKNYLFDQINLNYEDFRKNIYTYNNGFSQLIDKYHSYDNPNLSLEEVNTKSELKMSIINQLSIYSNYRGLAIARQKSEEYQPIFRRNANREPAPTVIKKESEFKPSITPEEFVNINNNFINYNGEEREEFLELSEFEEYPYKEYKKERY